MKKKNIKIADDLHTKLKVLCAQHHYPLNQFVDDLIKANFDHPLFLDEASERAKKTKGK